MEQQEAHPLVPQLRLDELLTELQVRLQNILATRDRTHALLEAVVASALTSTLRWCCGRSLRRRSAWLTPAMARWA